MSTAAPTLCGGTSKRTGASSHEETRKRGSRFLRRQLSAIPHLQGCGAVVGYRVCDRSQGLYAMSPPPWRRVSPSSRYQHPFAPQRMAAGPGFRHYLLTWPQQSLLETCHVGCLLPAHSPRDGFILQHTELSWDGGSFAGREIVAYGRLPFPKPLQFLALPGLAVPPKPRSRRAHVVLRGKWAKNIQPFAGMAPFLVCRIPPLSPSPFL